MLKAQAMRFPVAGVEIHPLVPVLAAFLISFCTSMGGVSGAFLLLPFQMSVLGFVSPAVSATNQLFNVVAIPGGIYGYARERRMLWPLAAVIILGTLPGVLLDAVLRIQYLPDPVQFKRFVGVVLLYTAGRLLMDIRSRSAPATGTNLGAGSVALWPQCEGVNEPPVVVSEFNTRRIVYTFSGETFRLRTISVTGLSFVIGIVGGIYGIGGGAIIAPFLVTYFRLPIHTVAGATLLATFVTSVVGVLFYQFLAPFYPAVGVAPDWSLGTLFGAGGLLGMYWGSRAQRRASPRAIQSMLCFCVGSAGAMYLLGLL